MPLNLTDFNQFTSSIKSAGQENSAIIWSRWGLFPGPGFRFCRSFTVIISSW